MKKKTNKIPKFEDMPILPNDIQDEWAKDTFSKFIEKPVEELDVNIERKVVYRIFLIKTGEERKKSSPESLSYRRVYPVCTGPSSGFDPLSFTL